MTPEKFLPLLTGLDRAADLVEAIDNPELQKQRGWDLAHWNYQMVPWGVRFAYRDPRSRNLTEVLARISLDAPVLLSGNVQHDNSSV